LNKISTPRFQYNKLIVVLLLFLTVASFIIALYSEITVTKLQQSALNVLSYVEANQALGMILFIIVYILANALPVPFVSVLTIAAGFLFGTIKGLAIVSFANAIGATLLFLMSRYLFKDWVKHQLETYSTRLSQSVENTNFWYAVSLRLIPGMPFSVPSMALSVTSISLTHFYLSTQLGLFFILAVYVNAGSQLTQLSSMNDIFNTQLVISMLLLAVIPLLLNFVSKRYLKLSS